MTFSIPPRGSVEVNIASPERARLGVTLASDGDGPTLPPGVYELSVQVGSESAAIEPTSARLRLTHAIHDGAAGTQSLDLAIIDRAEVVASKYRASEIPEGLTEAASTDVS